MTSYNYIGIDISKKSLVVHCESFRGSFQYDEQGLKKLLDKLKTITEPLVACEATGGYERKLMDFLNHNHIAVALVNPARVRDFARSDGLKAKTDPIDAALLMRFACSKKLRPTIPLTDQQKTLQALMDRRSQLTGMLAQEKNRLEKEPKQILKSIKKIISILEKELAAIDKQIEGIIAKDETLSVQSTKMQTVVGIGPATAWTIIAYLGEINQLGRNQVVALAGLAPFADDSGPVKGKRRIEGGRAKVRKCLYMAAQSAAVHNPHIKEYVDRLRGRGKPYKWAIVAAMRKLLIHLQSLLKNPENALA